MTFSRSARSVSCPDGLPLIVTIKLGTGTSARLAVMHARGQIGVGEDFTHHSIIGSSFLGRIEATTTVGTLPAIVPSITGRAWLTAFHQYVLDPDDPFPTGYRIADTWPMERRDG